MELKNMTKEDIIFQLLISLNQGDSYYVTPESERVKIAIGQYNSLVKQGIIKE